MLLDGSVTLSRSGSADTDTLKLELATKVPSVAVRVMVVVPLLFVTGVRTTVQLGALPAKLMPVAAITEVADDDFRMLEVQLSTLSTSLTLTEIGPDATSSDNDWFATAEMVGASFTGVTARLKTSCAVKVPSVTVRVIVAVPFALATGNKLTVQLGAVPANVIPELPMRPVSLEVPESAVAQSKADSASLITTAIPASAVSSLVV